MPKALSKETLNSVLALLDSDKSHAEIMARTGVSSGYITKVTAKHRPDLQRSTGGHPRKLDPHATRYAVRLVTNGSTISTRQATQTLSTLTGESISPRTVRRALKQAGLRPVKKVRKPRLTPRHIKERLAFAKAHQYWTIEDWKRVGKLGLA